MASICARVGDWVRNERTREGGKARRRRVRGGGKRGELKTNDEFEVGDFHGRVGGCGLGESVGNSVDLGRRRRERTRSACMQERMETEEEGDELRS